MTPQEIAVRALGALEHHTRAVSPADRLAAYTGALELVEAKIPGLEEANRQAEVDKAEKSELEAQATRTASLSDVEEESPKAEASDD